MDTPQMLARLDITRLFLGGQELKLTAEQTGIVGENEAGTAKPLFSWGSQSNLWNGFSLLSEEIQFDYTKAIRTWICFVVFRYSYFYLKSHLLYTTLTHSAKWCVCVFLCDKQEAVISPKKSEHSHRRGIENCESNYNTGQNLNAKQNIVIKYKYINSCIIAAIWTKLIMVYETLQPLLFDSCFTTILLSRSSLREN